VPGVPYMMLADGVHDIEVLIPFADIDKFDVHINVLSEWIKL
jgi:hypothetical protein